MPQFEEEKKLLNIWLKEKNIYFEYIKTEAWTLTKFRQSKNFM